MRVGWRRMLGATAVGALAFAAFGAVPGRADVAWPPNPTPGPTAISASGHDSLLPVVTSLGGGDALAAWIASPGCGCATIESARYSAATNSWTAVAIPGQTLEAFFSPFSPGVSISLTGNGSGKAALVWTADTGGSPPSLVMQAANFDGSAWSAPVSLSDVTTYDALFGSVEVAPNGTAVAVWTANDGSNTSIQASVFDGTSWQSTADTVSSEEGLGFAKVASVAGDTAIAVWQDQDCGCGSSEIDTAYYDGTSWHVDPASVSDPSNDSTEPDLVATAPGTAVAAWTTDDGSNPTFVESATFDNTVGWAAPSTISDVSNDADSVALAATGSGHAAAVWLEGCSCSAVVRAATFDGTSWAAGVDVSSAGDNVYPDVAGIDNGDAVIVWNNQDSNIIVQAAVDGTAVTAPVELSSAEGGILPQVTGTADGAAIAVWTGYDGTNERVKAALAAPTAVTTPVPGSTATIATSAGGIIHEANSAVPATPLPPAGLQFPYGLIAFDIVNLVPGASATVTITLPAPVTQYWKLQNAVWSKLTGATFSGNHATFTLTDGGTGDADGTANGTIQDPGAPVTVLRPITGVTPSLTG